MKLRQTLLNVLTAVVLAVPAVSSAQVRDASEIVKPELRPFRPEQPRLVTLPNGMVLMLQSDRELPLVRGYAMIRGGSRDEPADKVGMVTIFGEAWRTGGTKVKGHDGDALDELLEGRAALVETHSSLDWTAVSWNCLKGDFETVLGVVKELLTTEPAFPQDKIDVAKTQLNSAIARRNDDPDGIARREARKLAYGAASPYARQAEYATVAQVTRDDLAAWHRRYVHPSNIVMAVWGDFDAAQMEGRLRRAFADWPRGTPAKAAQIPVPGPRPGHYLIEKDDATQSTIQLVHLGLRLDHPDYFAIQVMNEVFGEGFSSRLFTNVRSKQALAYAVGGSLGMAYDYPGLLTVGMGTKGGNTVRGIGALLAEIDGMTQQPITDVELARAKDGLLNSFIFRIDSREKVLRQKVNDFFHGYPLDRLERYMEGIRGVSAADVQRVARQHLHKDKLAILVVGKPSEFDRPLPSLGPVTKIDITIPTPDDGKAAPAVTVSDEAGRALLRKAVATLGDPQKVRDLKATRIKAKVVMPTPQGEMSAAVERALELPNRVYQKMTVPMGEMSMVITPQAAFMATGGQTRDMPASQRDEQRAGLLWEPLCLAQRVDDPGLVVTLAGSERVADVEASVLAMSLDGQQARWLVDPATGRLLRMTRRAMGRMGPVDEARDFSDYRVVDGFNLAFQEKAVQGGNAAESLSIESYELNPVIDATLFERPKPAQP